MSAVDKIKQLAALCESSVTVTINEHRDFYESVSSYVQDHPMNLDHEELDPADLARMIQDDRIVEVQWYPNSPVGFCVAFGYDLDQVLDKALATFGAGQ